MTAFPATLTVAPTADTPRHGITFLSTRRLTAKSHRLWASPAKIPIKRMQGPARFAGKRHEDYCKVQRLPTPTTFVRTATSNFPRLGNGDLSGSEIPHGVKTTCDMQLINESSE